MTEDVLPEVVGPQWLVGMRWRVEYWLAVPAEKKQVSTTPPPPERSVWRYEVARGGPDEEDVVIFLGRDGADDERYELAFRAADRTLHRVVKMVDGTRHLLIENREREAYVGWSYRHPVIFEWPRFPSRPRNETRVVTLEGRHTIEQVTAFTDRGGFETRMTSGDGTGEGLTEVRRCQQSWRAGQRWWSSASVETEYSLEGNTATIVLIRGQLMES